MTRKEQTGIRDLTFSRWVREKLPDSNTGFMVSDIDFFMYNYKTKKCMLLEIKTHKANIKPWQYKMYQLFEKWIVNGIDDGWVFYGFHVIRFEKTCFEDGRCMLDKNLIKENDLIKFLSMEYQYGMV